MNALRNIASPVIHVTLDTPDVANQRAVEAEIKRLVDDETFDERGQDREFTAVAMRIKGDWWSTPYRWVEAFVDVPYKRTWSDDEFMRLVHNCDDTELGRIIRERTLAELADDVFHAAAEEFYR